MVGEMVTEYDEQFMNLEDEVARLNKVNKVLTNGIRRCISMYINDKADDYELVIIKLEETLNKANKEM